MQLTLVNWVFVAIDVDILFSALLVLLSCIYTLTIDADVSCFYREMFFR